MAWEIPVEVGLCFFRAAFDKDESAKSRHLSALHFQLIVLAVVSDGFVYEEGLAIFA